MAKTYGFGVVGTGFIGGVHGDAIAGMPNAKLVACCDAVEASAKRFGEKHHCDAYTDLDEMLKREDVDVISIATPSGMHMEAAVAAAKAGKHALVEKPLDITLERCDAILEAHDKAGTTVGGIFNGRFYPTAQLFKKAADQGRFGKMTFGLAYGPWWRSQKYYDEGGWKGTWKYDGGGAYMNQGIHTVDMLQWLMGPVEWVNAKVDMLAHKNVEVEDTGAAVVKFKNGALGTMACASSMYPGHFRIIEVAGDKGTVAMADTNFFFWRFAEETPEDEKVRKEYLAFPAVGIGADDPATGVTGERHLPNFADFLQAIDEGREPLVSGPESRKSVEIIVAIYRSSKTGQAVELPLKS
ncbi:MAG: Gfo/Idh/MocA family oxidoreductase [Phycisphaerae bacterium]|nr:Gfo/Idh/MocA family oxidoreductase [Phycisphaerae bacterium]